jgi:hypothetical protein
VIDVEILEKCSELNYYPYEFTCIPTKKIMLLECSRNNLNTLIMLKEKGGIIDVDCLNSAVSLRRNGKIIKYIINSCSVNPNTETLRLFQEVNGIECLDLLISNYKSSANVSANASSTLTSTNCLDPQSLLTIEPFSTDFEIDYDCEYILHNKIKKMLGYKRNKIVYYELEKLLLKYIIDNKLVIANYFILNDEFANIIKMDKGVIMHIDQIKNMIPYFVNL